MVKENTFYEVLEITRGNYTEEMLRQSYHSLLSYHASQVWENRDEGEEQLSVINRAYTTLRNPKKRFIYNTYGENGITRYEASIKNPYEQVAAIRFPLQVTPDQLNRGETIMYQVGRQICCRKCLGNGRLHDVCKKCEGLGGCMEIKVGNENNSNPYKENMIKCNVCCGVNYFISGCEHCKGKGLVESSTTFHLTLDNTMKDGTILTLLDVGNEKPGLTTGNVEFEVKIFQSFLCKNCRPVETQSDNAGPQPGTSDESSGNSPDNPRNDPGNGRIVDLTQSGNDIPHSSNQLAFPGHVNGWVRPMGHVRYLSQNGVCFQDGTLVGENQAYNGNFSGGAVATGTTSAIETLGVAAVTVNAGGGCILALNNGTASEESSHNQYGENSSNSLALVQIPEGEQQQEHNDSGERNRVGLDYSFGLGDGMYQGIRQSVEAGVADTLNSVQQASSKLIGDLVVSKLQNRTGDFFQNFQSGVEDVTRNILTSIHPINVVQESTGVESSSAKKRKLTPPNRFRRILRERRRLVTKQPAAKTSGKIDEGNVASSSSKGGKKKGNEKKKNTCRMRIESDSDTSTMSDDEDYEDYDEDIILLD